MSKRLQRMQLMQLNGNVDKHMDMVIDIKPKVES